MTKSTYFAVVGGGGGGGVFFFVWSVRTEFVLLLLRIKFQINSKENRPLKAHERKTETKRNEKQTHVDRTPMFA